MVSKEPTIIALIPARSGSTRLKNKNIKELEGHPLIAYAVAQAQSAGIFEAIVVSTDSEEIAAVARHYGAEAPFLRPKEYAQTHSPDIEWLKFTLEGLKETGRTYDCFALLRPTSPLRQPEMILRAWKEFRETPQIDSIRAVQKVKEHPGKMWVVYGDRMAPLLPSPKEAPWHGFAYQALPEVFIQNTSLEIAWTRLVLEENTRSGEKIAPFFTEGYEGFDINDPEDWWQLEDLIRRGEAVLPNVSRKAYMAK